MRIGGGDGLCQRKTFIGLCSLNNNNKTFAKKEKDTTYCSQPVPALLMPASENIAEGLVWIRPVLLEKTKTVQQSVVMEATQKKDGPSLHGQSQEVCLLYTLLLWGCSHINSLSSLSLHPPHSHRCQGGAEINSPVQQVTLTCLSLHALPPLIISSVT